MILPARLADKETKIMVDSGAIGNYISSGCVKRHQIETCNKSKPYQLALADGSAAGQTGRIGEETMPTFLKIGKHMETIVLDIVNIKYDIILGIPWLEHHDPMINWKARTLAFNHCECDRHTNGDVPFTKAI